MKNVSLKYVEIACKKTGMSKSKIAMAIGVSPAQITAMNTRDHELKDDALLQLAHFAQVSPMKIIAEKHKRQAKGQAERKFWDALSRSKEVLEETKRYILCSIQNDIKIF